MLPPPQAVSDPSGLFYLISQSRVRQWRRLPLKYFFFMECPVIDGRPYRYYVVSYRGREAQIYGWFPIEQEAKDYAASLSKDFPRRKFHVFDCFF